MKLTYLISSIILLAHPYALANENDPSKLCNSAAKLYKDGDLEGALEEARWCVTQLEQLKQNQTATYFKKEIHGYLGNKVSQQTAMGMTIVERRYKKDDKVIQVTLTGGSSGGAMSAFSALAQMGTMAAGTNKVRIQRRTATINNDSGNVTVMVSLKSGSMLNFQSNNVSQEELLRFAKAFPVKELDNSLQE